MSRSYTLTTDYPLVSLARAVYSRASVILLDDVISAVDAQTSQHIVQHCFKSPLMTERTLIIASHAVESLAPLANQAILLDDGKAVWQGTGPQLLESEHMAHLQTESYKNEIDSSPDRTENIEAQIPHTVDIFTMKEAIPKTPKQIILEEQRAKGNVDLYRWRDLLNLNGSNLFWATIVILMLAGCLAPVADKRVLE